MQPLLRSRPSAPFSLSTGAQLASRFVFVCAIHMIYPEPFKGSTIINYDSRVVPDLKIHHIMTLINDRWAFIELTTELLRLWPRDSFIVFLLDCCDRRNNTNLYRYLSFSRLGSTTSLQLLSRVEIWPRSPDAFACCPTQLPLPRPGLVWITSLIWCMPRGPLCTGKKLKISFDDIY